MTLEYAFYAVLAYTMLREVFFLRTLHTLVDKIMCRNLHEYELAKTIHKRKEKEAKPQIYDESDAEDLGALQGLV